MIAALLHQSLSLRGLRQGRQPTLNLNRRAFLLSTWNGANLDILRMDTKAGHIRSLARKSGDRLGDASAL